MRNKASVVVGGVVETEIRRVPWQQTVALCHGVLWPNKEPEFCHVGGDEDAWHFGAFLRGSLISVASVYLEGKNARLRKFATAPARQGKGVGTKVLQHILSELREQRMECFWCDARESAIGFYARFGLEPEGERPHKDEVQYFKMGVRVG